MNESPARPTLHVIAHIHWEREGYESFETRRARLMATLTRLLNRMNADQQPLNYLLLGGQTVILEDIATIRPDLLSRLVIYNAGGRLGVGPWYVLMDEMLVSGESLVRNLLLGRADARQHGLTLKPVAYVPDSTGHTAQLPQILCGFGIEAAVLAHGAPVGPLPFRWDAPDGSTILVANFDRRTSEPSETDEGVQDVLAEQQVIDPDGPFLWMDEAPLHENTPVNALAEDLGMALTPSTLIDYLTDLRGGFPDSLRPVLRGELRVQGMREHAYLLPGTMSSRLYLKQANARLESRLTHLAEPLLALALANGAVEVADNLRALLTHSWRLLLKNQSRSTLGGCGSDPVHEETEIRYRQVEDTSTEVIAGALNVLPGDPHAPGSHPSEQVTHIVVWNPHSHPAQQVIELTLDLPAGQYPAQVVGPDGEVCAFGWTESGVFSLLPEVPPVGYATYTLDLSDQPPTGDSLARTTPGDLIRSMTGDTLMIENGQIIWNHQGIAIPDVLRFFDSGDAGDTYNYSPPDPDIMVQAQLTGTISVEHAPLYERLIFRHRMRIAPELDANRGRDRGVRLMELSTTATFYDHMPGLYFRTTFENAAGDHRLRAHLRTGIASETVLADAAFALVERPVVVPGPEIPPEGQANIEGVMSTHPMQNLCAVLEGENTVALMARGLPEFQAIPEDDQTTLALTLLRAVGWLSRDDLRTRTGSVGPMLAVPGAQCLRPMATEYALVSLEDGNPADLLRLGQAYRAPLPAYQYDHPPEQRSYSYLSVEGDRVVMTALKPPQEGEGWLVRLLNPTDEPAEAMLIAHARLSGAELVTLAEEAQAEFELENPEQVHLTLEPHKITTLRLRFQ